MDLLQSFMRRYVLDSISRIAHSFLCTCRSTVSSTHLAGLEKSELEENQRLKLHMATSAALHIRHLPYVHTVHNSGRR